MGTSIGPEPRPRLLPLILVASLLLAGCEEDVVVPGGAEVTAVGLNPPSFPLAVGEVLRPDVITVNAQDRLIVGGPVTWRSSDTTIASVDSLGLIRGVKEGKATVTATVSGLSANTVVTVTPVPASEWREHSCFVTIAGQVLCWGRGGNGELGDGERSSGPIPTTARVPEPAALVSTGASHSCAVGSSGAGYCWGLGADGQLGNGATATQVKPVKIEFGLSFKSLSAGGRHTCGITAAGETRCWGLASSGQLGNGATTAVTTPVPTQGDLRFTQIAAGARHTCGIQADGQAFCWGDNAQGQLGDGSNTNRTVPTPVVTAIRFAWIAAGARHTCAVSLDGRGWCWGDNRQGQLGNGTLVASAVPQQVRSTPDFRLVRVSAGGSHSCGIGANGYGYCWGAGQFGQLGDGTKQLVGNPVTVLQSLYTDIVAGAGHSCGVTPDEGVLCWGLGAYGQLGLGDFADRAVPAWILGSYRFSRAGG